MRNRINFISPIGNICIVEEDGFIVEVGFKKRDVDCPSDNVLNCKRQLEEYFLGKRKNFNVKYRLLGSNFQEKVWHELEKIPYGETKSYKDIAKAVGNDKASRAVGGANNKNPIAIIVPCHRVKGTNNKLIGYAGGLEIKKFLLELEERWK